MKHPQSVNMTSIRATLRAALAITTAVACWGGILWTSTLSASDHADPIDPFNRERLEGGLTDLFVFPVDRSGVPLEGFTRKSKVPLADPLADIVRTPLEVQDRKKIHSLVLILCLRRQLTQSGSLNLEPYRYQIHIDVDSVVEFPTEDDVKEEREQFIPGQPLGQAGYGSGPGTQNQSRPTLVESFARYGGKIKTPSEINEDVIIELELDNHAGLKNGFPRYRGAAAASWNNEIVFKSGIYDDPFIFPAFFGTNVVAVALKVPIEFLSSGQENFLIWATSHKGDRQVDHVGRSLRTQNPRFELLNTLHPKDHVKAIQDEHENPSLMRDLFLRFNFSQEFAYRSWDFVPDVMCYSLRYPAGYPNGRLLTDDVAALLAQHGDTLLYELSYQHRNGNWPRQQTNDKSADPMKKGVFNSSFPYLLEPHPEKPAIPPLRLTNASRWKLAGIAAAILLVLLIENWIVARIYHRIKLRKRKL